jgi:hypothetical protein
MLRSAFTHKQKSILNLRELVLTLNDSQRGVFQSHSKLNTRIDCFCLDQIMEQIEQLCKRVPEWLQVREVSGTKYLKVVGGNITGQRVQELIRDRGAMKEGL